jgi:hypothetical protein
VDKSQKSEGTSGHSRYGWDVLIFPISRFYGSHEDERPHIRKNFSRQD